MATTELETVEITALPKRASSQLTQSDFVMGVASNAEGYGLTIKELGDYIIQYVASEINGKSQTLRTAIESVDFKDMSYHYCSTGEYDATTGVPTIANPDPETFYLAPSVSSNSDFNVYYYKDNEWVLFTTVELDLTTIPTDKTLTQPDVAADAKAVGDEISNLKDDLNNKICPYFSNDNIVSEIIDSSYTTDDITSQWVIKNIIDDLIIEPNTLYTIFLGNFIKANEESLIRIYIYDSNNNETNRINITETSFHAAFISGENDVKIRVALFFNNGTVLANKASCGVHEFFICKGEIKYHISDPEMSYNGGNGAFGFKMHLGQKLDTSNGNIIGNNEYATTNFIPIESNQHAYIKCSGTINIALYDNNKSHVSFAQVQAGETKWRIWQKNVFYMRATAKIEILKEAIIVVQPYAIPDYADEIINDLNGTKKALGMSSPAIIDNNVVGYNIYDELSYTADSKGYLSKAVLTIDVVGGENYAISLDDYEGFPHSSEYVLVIYGKDSNNNTTNRLYFNDSTGKVAIFTPNAQTVKILIQMEVDRDQGIFITGTAKIYGLRVYSLGNNKKIGLNNIYTLSETNITLPSLPSYYNSYMKTKVDEIRQYDDAVGNGGDRFIFITDYHDYYNGNANKSPLLIRYIIDNVPVSMTIFGGDGVNAADEESEMKNRMISFLHRFDNIPNFYPIIGNHEFCSDWLNEGGYKGGITKSEVYAYFTKWIERNVDSTDGLSGFRIDNRISKIRYYLIGCDYYVNVDNGTKIWCFNDIKNTPDDYTIIFIAHYALSVSNNAVDNKFMDLHDAIVAINNKQEYVYDGITYDFTHLNNVKVPIVIAGHTHADGDLIKDGIIYVSVTTDHSRNALVIDSSVDRTIGTVNEQAFDVVSIDKESKKIYFTRIGGGNSREFNYS